ncbi:General stress protein 26 [Prosthecobacter debontii]|uniref:General stress protein 26 n=1 Tax=Prosthecobacter debontii TaxID=48467 RepID=A0A1T4XI05_9BACT|nr:pyridoxamine 5'-phosphate oxidase family protein [Prosthecobacter debontii]SKA88751.1 General stress protein 26 [Prosthecobacter debontii]
MPAPAPFDPADLPSLAQATLKAAKFPVLATVEGDQPRVRPVSPVRTEGFVVYVANLRRYGKTAELAANPKAELCYTDDDHNQVRITATAEILTDRALLEDIWNSNALLRTYLRDINNPELIIYKFTPTRVRYMKEWALEYHEVLVGQ